MYFKQNTINHIFTLLLPFGPLGGFGMISSGYQLQQRKSVPMKNVLKGVLAFHIQHQHTSTRRRF